MARVLSSIYIGWDDAGTISHRISGGYPDDQQNLLYVLAPSVPMLVGHQLGALQPSYGLQMCEQLLDLLEYGRYRHAPIDLASGKARIDWCRTRRGVTIKFYPGVKFLAANRHTEAAICQLVNNYAYHVMDRLPEDVEDSVKIFTALAIRRYLDTADRAGRERPAGPGSFRWHLGLSRAMAAACIHIADAWSPGLEVIDDGRPGDFGERLSSTLSQLRIVHHDICQRTGLRTHRDHS